MGDESYLGALARRADVRKLVLLLLSAIVIGQAGEHSIVVSVRASVQENAGTPDAAALILEVARRAKAVDRRRYEYTWTAKHTEREVNARGEVTKETVEVYETYPVRGETVKKLISRNGVAVSPKESQRELKRAMKKLEQAEREESKRGDGVQASTPDAASAPTDATGIPSFGPASGFSVRQGFKTSEIYVALWRFLRAGEFYAPRRESFRGRDCILLDFRPRADFRPANGVEQPYAKLVGKIWIDANDKAVVRLEAWPAAQASKYGQDEHGANSPAAPSIVYEQTRLPDGMWLESFVRIKTDAAPDVFNGVSVDYTKEVTDFRRFATDTLDVKMDEPKKQ